MNILYTNFHGGNGGGHVTYIINLLRGLRADHTLTVACPASSRLYRLAAEVEGVKLIAMEFTTRPSSWLGARATLRSLLLRESFDIIHVNGSADHKQVMLASLGMIRRPYIVFTKHNDHSLKSFGHLLRARLATDHVIAVSDYIREQVQHSFYRHCDVTTVRHGVDTGYFAPVTPEEKAMFRARFFDDTTKGKIILGSAGGTDLEKGWLDLVFALARLPESLRARFHLVVAGDPPRPELLAQVSELGLLPQVTFPGLLDDVRPLLAACDAGFVLSYQEALSFACRELMALGLPVLVTRVGGLPENLVDGEQGWIVEARDVSGMTEVLRKIADQPSVLSQFGRAARAHAEKYFNLHDFSRETFEVYQQCCVQRQAQPR